MTLPLQSDSLIFEIEIEEQPFESTHTKVKTYKVILFGGKQLEDLDTKDSYKM